MTLTKHKILVIDDELDILEFIKKYLERRGVLVRTEAGGSAGYAMIKSWKPDIVLLDISIPDMDGFEVLRQLRETDKTTKVVMVTGHGDKETRLQAEALGITAFLEKPLILEEVGEVIFSIIEERPLPELKFQNADISGEKKEDAAGLRHRLVNLLGNIRNKCENFTLNFKEGFYDGKSKEELLAMSVEIMENVINNVDDAVEVMDQLKAKQKN
jgi:DNA-binding response OmpR family regulator